MQFLSALAAIACATLATASPIVELSQITGPVNEAIGPVSGLLPALPIRGLPVVGDVPAVGGVVGTVTGTVGGVTGNVPVVGGLLPRDEITLVGVFTTVTTKVLPITEKIRAAVAVKAEIDIDVVVGLCHEIIVVLEGAVVDVQYIVDHPVETVLRVGETVVSIKEVAFIISTLLGLVFTVLSLVVSTVDVAVVGVVLPLVATIGALLAKILGLVFILVPGLLAVLVPTIAGLVHTIVYLRLVDIVAVLGLKVSL